MRMGNRQQGATLLVVLVMLVVLTLFGVAGIKMSNTSLLVIGNMQSRKYVENYAQQGIEDVMNNIAPFSSPTGNVTLRTMAGGTVAAAPGTEVDVPGTGLKATLSSRICVGSDKATGFSEVVDLTPFDNIWEFSITVRDTLTGAQTRMVQGAKIRQLAGYC